MISVKVENGMIETKIKSEDSFRVYTEITVGVANLLAEFKAELIKKNIPAAQVDVAIQEMFAEISKEMDLLTSNKLSGTLTEAAWQSDDCLN